MRQRTLASLSDHVKLFKIDKRKELSKYLWFLSQWMGSVVSGDKLARDVVITNELGLHARSAAQIAKLTNNAMAQVWLKKGDEKADASSILDILTLACAKGTSITIIIEDPADLEILNAITTLVESGFGE